MNWKIISFILLVAILVLSFNFYQQSKVLDFGDFEIKEKDFNVISDSVIGDFAICDIDENKCIKVNYLP